MPPLSQRAGRLPASPIRKLAPFALAAVARGTKIYHLNIGQPDVPSPELFWEAVKGACSGTLEYGPSNGIPQLIKKAADFYRGQGFPVGEEDVMVTTGGSECLNFVIGCVCDPGDEVIVMDPMYANYISFAEANGAKVVPIPTDIEDGFRLPPPERFEAVITPKTRAVIVCNPNNPTGTVYPRAALESLASVAKRHGLFIISDEAYREFNYTDQPVTSILELPGLEDNAVMVDTASKRFSLCGARIGFLVTKNKDLRAAVLRYGQARLCPPTLDSIGVAAAFDTPPEYYEQTREEYRKRRDLVVGRLRKMPGVFCPEIQGAFYATVRLPVKDGDAFCQWLLDSFQEDGETVMLAPASGFYASPGLGKDQVRVAYVLSCERLARAMDLLQIALQRYPDRTN